MTKPIHRQFGSKARVAGKILSLVRPGKRIWCEVFAGTAAVTLAKEPHPEEHLNDMNGEIVNLFRVLRDDVGRRRLVALVDLTAWSEGEYRECRRSAPPLDDPVARAWRYLVLSWQGFNGDCAKGSAWKSFDGSHSVRTKTWDGLPLRLELAARRLKRAFIHQKPALKMLEMVGRYEGAVVFADPPYPLDTVHGARSSYGVDMSAEEHEAFANALRAVKSDVILTMSKGTVYERVLRDWPRLELPVRGLLNTVKIEYVFTNYDPPAVQSRLGLVGAAE